jgi:hypothetical protein
MVKYDGITILENLMTAGKDLYCEFLTVNLLNCFIQTLKIRYEDLNETVLNIGIERNVVRELTKLAHCYRILGDTIDIFNKIFGVEQNLSVA